MARNSFPVEVLTPEGQVFAAEVEMVSTRTTIGSIGVLANHAPLMAILEPTELRLYKSESESCASLRARATSRWWTTRRWSWSRRRSRRRTSTAAAFETRLKEARDAAERAEEGSEERARAEREVKRYEAFLKVGAGD